jgi:hypothetical protein
MPNLNQPTQTTKQDWQRNELASEAADHQLARSEREEDNSDDGGWLTPAQADARELAWIAHEAKLARWEAADTASEQRKAAARAKAISEYAAASEARIEQLRRRA